MGYFEAVQEGRVRVQRAVETLQEVAGPCYPLLFLKMGVKGWTPVGEESLFSVVKGKNSTAAIVLCDSDGNSKTMSAWIPAPEAESLTNSLASKGIPRYDGEVKLPI